MTKQEFIQKIRTKYPSYEGVDDETLYTSIMDKYPQYQKQVRQPFGQDLKDDFLGMGQDIVDEQMRLTDSIKESTDLVKSGEQGAVRGGLQIAGKALGSAARQLGNTVINAGKMLLPQKAEDKIGEAVQKGAQKVLTTDISPDNSGVTIQKGLEKYQEWKSGLEPKQQEDMAALEGLAEFAAELTGVRGAKTAARPVLSQTKAFAADVAERAAKLKAPKVELPGAGAVGQAAKEVAKTVGMDEIRDKMISRTFGFSPTTDIANFRKIANDDNFNIGEFMQRYDLIKNTREDTVEALTKFKNENFETVRDAVLLVDDTYSVDDVTGLRDMLEAMKSDVRGKPGLESYEQRISEILDSDQIDLYDVQTAKGLFDDIESVYKRSGEPKEGFKSMGLSNLRQGVKEFIENRVSDKYPEIDIKELNQNTRISKATLDAIALRAGKQDTGSALKFLDVTTFGFGSLLHPAIGLGALGIKKFLESSPIRLRIAKFAGKRADDIMEGRMNRQDFEKIKELLAEELTGSLDLE